MHRPHTQKKQSKKTLKKKDQNVFTNVSLNVVRKMGKYLNDMDILQPIAHTVFQSFTTLYKFYVCRSLIWINEKN